jgi:hypothetical protein
MNKMAIGFYCSEYAALNPLVTPPENPPPRGLAFRDPTITIKLPQETEISRIEVDEEENCA